MRLAAAGAVALCLSLPVPASAATAQRMAPNSVVNLPDPGTTLGVPADGRLRGYEFSADVLGAAAGALLDQPGGTITAATGQRLWVFGMRWTDGTVTGGGANPVNPTIVVDGTRIPIPLPDGYGNNVNQDYTFDTGPMYWVASLPAHAKDVVVELTSAGVAQDFSLTRMSREGPQPAVLYRDPSSWQVREPLALEHDIPAPDPEDPAFVPYLPVKVGALTLTFFGPDNTSDVPADPTQAWLIPGLTSLGFGNNNQGNVCFSPLPPSDITLTLPGGQPITSTAFPGLGSDQQGVGAFTAEYGFKVPASITTAVLTVNPGRTQVGFVDCSAPDTVTLGSAVFDLNLPAPQAQRPSPGAVASPPAIHTIGSTHVSAEPASKAPPIPGGVVVLVVIVAALAGVGAPVILRRRRRRSPKAGSTPVAPPPHEAGTAATPPFDNPTAPTPPASNGSHAGTMTTPAPPSDAAALLLVAPEVPPPLPEDAVEIQILGSERLVGWPSGEPEPGPTLVEADRLSGPLPRGPALCRAAT